MKHSILKHLYRKSHYGLTSLACFSQNSNAYKFLLNENMTLTLHLMTHFNTIFLGIQLFLLLLHIYKGNGYEARGRDISLLCVFVIVFGLYPTQATIGLEKCWSN